MKGKKRIEITSQESEDRRKVNVKSGYLKYLESLSKEEYTKHFSDIHQKSFSSAGIKPNKLEMCFNEFLNSSFPNEWRYTGDGAIWINGKNPDFISIGKKLIIEIFGDYWHRGEDPLDRMAIFKSAGYDTLVIWESEFNGNKFAVKQKIEEFNGKRHIKILKVEREFYSGFVYNLEVENDHSYCGKGIIFHNCYHLAHIKEAIRINPMLSKYLKDMSPQSDSIINYRMGNKKMKVYASGIMAVKRGIHTDLAVIADDILGDLANPMILTEMDKVKRLFNAEIMNIPNSACPLFVFGTVMDYSDILFTLKTNPSFLSLWLPAINPVVGRDVLWPEQFGTEVLAQKKEATGWKAFSTEILLTPLMATMAFFNREELEKIINKSLQNFQVPGF